MEGWTISKVISEVINGVLVFRPDDLTPEEYAEWRIRTVAETNLFWERLQMGVVNTSHRRRIVNKVRKMLQYIKKR